jgi:hypothetical protein
VSGDRGGAGGDGRTSGLGRRGLLETEQRAGPDRSVGATGPDARGDRGLGGTDEGGALDEGLAVRGRQHVATGTAFATLEGQSGRTLTERPSTVMTSGVLTSELLTSGVLTSELLTSEVLTSTFDVTSRRATLIRRGRGGGLRHACGPLVWGWCEHSTLARIILEV